MEVPLPSTQREYAELLSSILDTYDVAFVRLREAEAQSGRSPFQAQAYQMVRDGIARMSADDASYLHWAWRTGGGIQQDGAFIPFDVCIEMRSVQILVIGRIRTRVGGALLEEIDLLLSVIHTVNHNRQARLMELLERFGNTDRDP